MIETANVANLLGVVLKISKRDPGKSPIYLIDSHIGKDEMLDILMQSTWEMKQSTLSYGTPWSFPRYTAETKLIEGYVFVPEHANNMKSSKINY